MAEYTKSDLMKMTVRALRDIAKTVGVKGASKMTKQQIVNAITSVAPVAGGGGAVSPSLSPLKIAAARAAAVVPDVYTKRELEVATMSELRKIAKGKGVTGVDKLTREQLENVIAARSRAELSPVAGAVSPSLSPLKIAAARAAAVVPDVYTKRELEVATMSELRNIAKDKGVTGVDKLTREQLENVIAARGRSELSPKARSPKKSPSLSPLKIAAARAAAVVPDVYTKRELEVATMSELRKIAKGKGVTGVDKLTREQLENVIAARGRAGLSPKARSPKKSPALAPLKIKNVLTVAELNAMPVTDLRLVAQSANVKGFSRMNRVQLNKAILASEVPADLNVTALREARERKRSERVRRPTRLAVENEPRRQMLECLADPETAREAVAQNLWKTAVCSNKLVGEAKRAYTCEDDDVSDVRKKARTDYGISPNRLSKRQLCGLMSLSETQRPTYSRTAEDRERSLRCLRDWTLTELRDHAKDLKIRGTSAMTRMELCRAIAEAKGKLSDYRCEEEEAGGFTIDDIKSMARGANMYVDSPKTKTELCANIHDQLRKRQQLSYNDLKELAKKLGLPYVGVSYDDLYADIEEMTSAESPEAYLGLAKKKAKKSKSVAPVREPSERAPSAIPEEEEEEQFYEASEHPSEAEEEQESELVGPGAELGFRSLNPEQYAQELMPSPRPASPEIQERIREQSLREESPSPPPPPIPAGRKKKGGGPLSRFPPHRSYKLYKTWDDLKADYDEKVKNNLTDTVKDLYKLVNTVRLFIPAAESGGQMRKIELAKLIAFKELENEHPDDFIPLAKANDGKEFLRELYEEIYQKAPKPTWTKADLIEEIMEADGKFNVCQECESNVSDSPHKSLCRSCYRRSHSVYENLVRDKVPTEMTMRNADAIEQRAACCAKYGLSVDPTNAEIDRVIRYDWKSDLIRPPFCGYDQQIPTIWFHALQSVTGTMPSDPSPDGVRLSSDVQYRKARKFLAEELNDSLYTALTVPTDQLLDRIWFVCLWRHSYWSLEKAFKTVVGIVLDPATAARLRSVMDDVRGRMKPAFVLVEPSEYELRWNAIANQFVAIWDLLVDAIDGGAINEEQRRRILYFCGISAATPTDVVELVTFGYDNDEQMKAMLENQYYIKFVELLDESAGGTTVPEPRSLMIKYADKDAFPIQVAASDALPFLNLDDEEDSAMAIAKFLRAARTMDKDFADPSFAKSARRRLADMMVEADVYDEDRITKTFGAMEEQYALLVRERMIQGGMRYERFQYLADEYNDRVTLYKDIADYAIYFALKTNDIPVSLTDYFDIDRMNRLRAEFESPVQERRERRARETTPSSDISSARSPSIVNVPPVVGVPSPRELRERSPERGGGEEEEEVVRELRSRKVLSPKVPAEKRRRRAPPRSRAVRKSLEPEEVAREENVVADVAQRAARVIDDAENVIRRVADLPADVQPTERLELLSEASGKTLAAIANINVLESVKAANEAQADEMINEERESLRNDLKKVTEELSLSDQSRSARDALLEQSDKSIEAVQRLSGAVSDIRSNRRAGTPIADVDTDRVRQLTAVVNEEAAKLKEADDRFKESVRADIAALIPRREEARARREAEAAGVLDIEELLEEVQEPRAGAGMGLRSILGRLKF